MLPLSECECKGNTKFCFCKLFELFSYFFRKSTKRNDNKYYLCGKLNPMRKITNQELGRLTPEEFKSIDKTPVVVVLDNVRSMNNIGAFFRTADAFAIERIVLCGITATPPNREIHKTALGAEQTVDWTYEKSTIEAVEKLKTEGYEVWAIEQVEGSVMLQNFEMKSGAKYAVVFGNEVMGVDQQVVDLCDGAIEIPQCGTKHSINVSVSGGVVLWTLFCEYQKLL